MRRKLTDRAVLYKSSIFVVWFLVVPNVFAQDTLFYLTYEELHQREAQAIGEENLEKLRPLTQVHLAKAKEENNPIEIARAFYFKVLSEESTLALAFSDSIISVTENSKHPQYPTMGYFLKGHTYYGLGQFQEALDNYLIGYNLALVKNNEEHQREISLAIAAIRNINGQHSAAADLYKRSLVLLQKQEDYKTAFYDDYTTLLYNLALAHLRMSQLDSATHYAAKGISLSKSAGELLDYRDFVLVDAQINYYTNEIGRAKDSLLKFSQELEGTNRAIKLYYLGKIEQRLNNEENAVDYFKKVDSIVMETDDPFLELKDVYQQLVVHSSLKDDKKGQVEYIDKLIYYDSLLSSQQKGISNQAIVAYDIPYLKYQKQKAEEELRVKNAAVSGVGLLAIMALLSGIYFYSRARLARSRLDALLSGSITNHGSTKKVVEHSSSVPQDIREDILQKLEEFEGSYLFLRKELDMSTLATEFGTNTTYLSMVINHYKGMSFPNYLKDLKISNAIEKLGDDPDLLKYNYQGLAELFGFKTGESFSKAFFKKTGVYPSKFLNELKSRKRSSDL